MENTESGKGPSVFDRAIDEVAHLKDTISEHLKEDVQDILHIGPQLLGKAKEEIQHLVDSAVHPKIQGGEEGESSTPVEASTPVVGENITAFVKEEVTAIAVKTIEIVKENQGSFLSFFANIFEKCCDFNKKQD